MSSSPCPLPGPDASRALFPDIAPVPSVVAAYPLGLSPATAGASDFPCSGPYGHLLPCPYPAGPTAPADAYPPCQHPAAPAPPPPQAPEAGKDAAAPPPPGSSSCEPLNLAFAWLGAASGIQTLLRFQGIWEWEEGKGMGRGWG